MRPLIVALALVPTTLSAQPAPLYGPPAPPAAAPAPVAPAAPPAPAFAPPPPPGVPPAPPAAMRMAYVPVLPPLPPPRQRPAIGLSLGGFHSKQAAMNGADASGTYGVFGRLGLSPHLYTQLDINRVDQDNSWKIYATTVSLAYAFGSSRLVPTLRAGLGYDKASIDDVGDGRSAFRVEVGAGLEARIDGGLLIGLDLAAGTRGKAEQVYCAYAVDDYILPGDFCLDPLQDGSYRSAKVTLGVAF